MEFDAAQFLKATGAKAIHEGAQKKCTGIATDTRTIQAGELFFALKGPHFDGHDHCKVALEKGAWGVVVERDPKTNNPWIFQVSDTLKALGDIAQWWRHQFNIPCIAITGSNGKTTTKEMTASITATTWNTLKTEGNFNNLIGLPLMINKLNKDHQATVFEIGMNDFGEIQRLTEIADPTVGVITNAAAAHLEKLHTVEAVAQAKSELYDTMNPKGCAVYNAEDEFLAKNVQRFKGEKISFGMRSNCDVSFEHVENIGFDSMELKLSIRGKRLQAKMKTAGLHNVMNAMAACGAALALKLPHDAMKEGLENFKPLKMRFEQLQLANGVRLVNDAYNANPLSMEAAFRTVGAAKRAGRFIAVLGDMKELGTESAKLHQEVGAKAVANGVTRLFVIGEFAKSFAEGAAKAGLSLDAVTIAENEAVLSKKLIDEIRSGDVVLVKGSRAMRLETLVDLLKERFG